VYRTQRNEFDTPTGVAQDALDVFVGDVFVRWDTEEPSGGRVFLAGEGAYVHGDATLFRSVHHPEHKVRQLMLVGQLGRTGESADFVIEGGWTSGDSNTEDAYQRRATLDPQHKVGLILFPEVLAWNTARSAALAGSEELFGRPAPGSELLPTNGGVSGAVYLFPHARFRPLPWLELRLGGVMARATSAVVDPFRQRAHSLTANYQGGDARSRDLGVEVDGSVLLTHDLPRGVTLSGGLEAGVCFPGRAFDNDEGHRMGTVGLGRVRLGMSF
jgi:hypothetical protein